MLLYPKSCQNIAINGAHSTRKFYFGRDFPHRATQCTVSLLLLVISPKQLRIRYVFSFYDIVDAVCTVRAVDEAFQNTRIVVHNQVGRNEGCLVAYRKE